MYHNILLDKFKETILFLTIVPASLGISLHDLSGRGFVNLNPILNQNTLCWADSVIYQLIRLFWKKAKILWNWILLEICSPGYKHESVWYFKFHGGCNAFNTTAWYQSYYTIIDSIWTSNQLKSEFNLKLLSFRLKVKIV